MLSFRELDLSFKSYLDEDKQLSLKCKAFIIALPKRDYPPAIELREQLKRMSLILKQQMPQHYFNFPDGFLVLNPKLISKNLNIAFDAIKYGLLTGFWNPDGYGLPYYLDKPNPDWVNAAMCADVQEKAEQKQIAKSAKQLYEELKNDIE